MLSNPLAALAHDLSNGNLSPDKICHLDPDIDRSALKDRPEGWRGAFGQVSIALGHLRNKSVKAGDLFLFWGLYRPVKSVDNIWQYDGPSQHAAFGWLMIDAVHDVVAEGSKLLATHPGLRDHPHVRSGWTGPNAVFVAAESFELDGRSFPGSGVFRQAFRLTALDSPRVSHWSVPAWLDPTRDGVGMTYHKRPSWLGNGLLETVGRGQEFVADIGDRMDARKWIADILEEHT